MEDFIYKFTNYISNQEGILGPCMVGSQARGVVRKDSDIDLVVITKEPSNYLNQNDCLNQFGIVDKIENEDFGLIQSRRVYYKDVPEVEFGITTVLMVKN